MTYMGDGEVLNVGHNDTFTIVSGLKNLKKKNSKISEI